MGDRSGSRFLVPVRLGVCLTVLLFFFSPHALAQTGTLTGRIIVRAWAMAPEQPEPNLRVVAVQLFAHDPNTFRCVAQTVTAADGTWTINDLEPGSYLIYNKCPSVSCSIKVHLQFSLNDMRVVHAGETTRFPDEKWREPNHLERGLMSASSMREHKERGCSGL